MSPVVTIILIMISVFVLCAIGVHLSTKSKISKLERKINEILILIHYYDSGKVSVEEGHKYLYMAYHLFIANILGNKSLHNIPPFTLLTITENGNVDDISFQDAMAKLMPVVQNRIENLPDPYKKEVFTKIIMDEDGTVRTETSLLASLRDLYDKIDFNSLKCNNQDNILINPRYATKSSRSY